MIKAFISSYNRFAKTPLSQSGDEGEVRFQASAVNELRSGLSLKYKKTADFQSVEAYKLIILILLIGFIYRLYLTSDGNFIFNMDNGRDFVEVREMVILQKLRLIGPTSAIEGFFNGPAWYYLLAIPFVFTGGDPYGAIIMEFILWAIGGFFLLKMASQYGKIALLISGLGWVASNIILLATAYSFNPNPVTLLTPLFIYLLFKYLKSGLLIYSVGMWLLGGLFFNFEMNFGIFTPFIILLSILLSKKFLLLKQKNFWIGIGFFIVCLLPQVIFDLKHNFLMTNSLLRYLTNTPTIEQPRNPSVRFPIMIDKFYSILVPGFMNNVVFTKALILIFFGFIFKFIKDRILEKDLLIVVILSYILVPFLGYVIAPVTVNSWHLGGIVASFVLLSGILISKLFRINTYGKIAASVLIIIFLAHSVTNISNYLKDSKADSMDPSLLRNEIKAVDYVYEKADGKNFKVYTFLPSIIDYPYQHLFWWRGLGKYGYVPQEYAYAPNVPDYISGKEKLPKGENPKYDGLVFLIKQPDARGERHLWENQFNKLELKSTEKLGPLIIETRQEKFLAEI